jgi:hypothetical protein
MENKFKTEAALVANLIKKELKAKWPNVKFSVRSSVFAGGDSVDVHYVMEDETYPIEKDVQNVVGKYQAGHFNGMEDIYEYNEGMTGPSVKYAFAQADTKKLAEKHLPDFLKHWGLSTFEDKEIMAKLGCWKEQALSRYLHEVILSK